MFDIVFANDISIKLRNTKQLAYKTQVFNGLYMRVLYHTIDDDQDSNDSVMRSSIPRCMDETSLMRCFQARCVGVTSVNSI